MERNGQHRSEEQRMKLHGKRLEQHGCMPEGQHGQHSALGQHGRHSALGRHGRLGQQRARPGRKTNRINIFSSSGSFQG